MIHNTTIYKFTVFTLILILTQKMLIEEILNELFDQNMT